MQHSATNLTPQQLQAIDLYARGQSFRCIAETVGITRETFWRWRQLPAFAAAITQARQLQLEQMRLQTAELMRLSLATLTRELRKSENPKYYNPVETAFKVLEFMRSTGLLGDTTAMPQPTPIAPPYSEIADNNTSLPSV
ncbi:MAG: helix-turn-helix domain-containing protein [Rickettsiales bacterium]